jgi:hypothetical protein
MNGNRDVKLYLYIVVDIENGWITISRKILIQRDDSSKITNVI